MCSAATLIVCIVVAGLGALFFVAEAVWRLVAGTGVHRATPVWVLPRPGAATIQIGDHARGNVSMANVVVDADLSPAFTLHAVADTIPLLLLALSLVVVAVLANRLLRARPFGRLLTWSLSALGTLMVVAAGVVPGLRNAAQQRVVEIAGLYGIENQAGAPIDGYLVVGPTHGFLWGWAIPGAILLLLTLLVHRATRLQADVEWLV